MPLSILFALLQETTQAANDMQRNIKIVCGVLALLLVGIIIMRRRGKKNKTDEEF